MDKYTVDLDKVLNDFEYSELTDQQQNSASPKTSNPSLQQQSIPTQITNVFPSTSKIKNVNSKHSITNVFNSLNEYLNTDISSGISKAKDSNVLHANDTSKLNLDLAKKSSYDNKIQFNNINLGLNDGSSLQNFVENKSDAVFRELLLPSSEVSDHLDEAYNYLTAQENNNNGMQENLIDSNFQNSVTNSPPTEGSFSNSLIDTNLIENDLHHNFINNSQEASAENFSKIDKNKIFPSKENNSQESTNVLSCISQTIQSDSTENVNDVEVSNLPAEHVASDLRLNCDVESQQGSVVLLDTNNIEVLNVTDIQSAILENISTENLKCSNGPQVQSATQGCLFEEAQKQPILDPITNETDKDTPSVNSISSCLEQLVAENSPGLVEVKEEIDNSQEIPGDILLKTIESYECNVAAFSNADKQHEISASNKEIQESKLTSSHRTSVGFDDTFDMDEAELNKYLDELEDEFEESHKHDVGKEDVRDINPQNKIEPSEELVDAKKLVESQETNAQSTVGNAQEITEVKTVEEGTQEMKRPQEVEGTKGLQGEQEINDNQELSKVKENVDAEETVEEVKNELEEKNCENEVELKEKQVNDETIEDKSTSGPSADVGCATFNEGERTCSENKESATDCSKSSDVSETTVVTEDLASVSSDDVNSFERPKTLELSYDSSDSKREINLIGDPGSTPYNNIYITKELPSDANTKMSQSDSDSTCSVSPTFSNASTESAHSSSSDATTDTANDDEDEGYVAKSAPVHPPQDVKCDNAVQVYSAVDNGKQTDNLDVKEKNVNNINAANVGSDEANLENVQNSPNNNSRGRRNETDDNTNNSSDTDTVANSSVDVNIANETISVEQVGNNVPIVSDEPSNVDISVNSSDNISSAGNNSDDATVTSANQDNPPIPSDTGAVSWLGKQAPLWIPDSEALSCLHCDARFTVIKRRHHCRACGLVLCSKCCNLKYKLEYLDAEARVCFKCYDILNKDTNSSSGSEVSPVPGNSPSRLAHQPNPNNPMEYCSVVPPLQQVSNVGQNPPSVMVPVGVLKRKGSSKGKSNKSVMFCDGIRPGSDLTNLDNDFNYSESKSPSSSKKASSAQQTQQSAVTVKGNKNLPIVDSVTKSFIPSSELSLPPTVTLFKSDISYSDCANSSNVVEMLMNETLIFALHRNLYVHVKIINMSCCINKMAWCFATEGLITVGQDEVIFLLEYEENEKTVPKDLLIHVNNIYNDAVKGTTVTELGISLHSTSNFLGSKNHAGFLYIRPTFQCLQNVIVPKEPYLIGILIHRWETPWAKIFPLRLILRLGAEYRYYPSPIISTRNRESVFVEIGHTIINLLADFRNFSYTLPNIRGLTIHMEEKNTTVTIPMNRYDQVMKSLNNSSDYILAFGGNFSVKADSHLVCIQDTQGNKENTYTTHAINIQNKPRKVTGASFIVFNGALKSSSGLTAKSSIVEDGLMVKIPAEHMVQVRDSLRNMKNHTIQCGCINAASDETVNIIWGEADVNFNLCVTSPIDKQSLSGVPSIRVHNGKDFVCNSGNRLIRWTEVFILQNGDENARTQQDPVDISKLAESISKATCQALVKYLDLLASNNFYKVGIRTTLHVENVSYCAGSNGLKLPPIYMRSLDNELVPVLHRITSNNLGENAIILELIFRILNV